MRIEKVIQRFIAADSVSEISGVKSLAGTTNAYRVRIGDYRLGFTVAEKTVRLVIFAHRKDIYRHFP